MGNEPEHPARRENDRENDQENGTRTATEEALKEIEDQGHEGPGPRGGHGHPEGSGHGLG